MTNPPESNGKNKKKRTGCLGVIAALIIVIVVVASCGGGDGDKSSNSTQATQSQTQGSASESSAPEAKKDDIPVEYQNALESAETYVDMNMSKKGLYDQLKSKDGDQFPPEAAKYAVEHVKADWKANALESAKMYQKEQHMSKSAIREQLTSSSGDQFTQSEADYAIKHLS
ncbi:MAG: Ltp family lipoprotein [Cutibacterium granulosum]|uniref:Ltp family lipoprotein n=1 Tax=Cutibacterium granulosum TaxID=33011 RepID=UPI00290AD6A6|nr:Ltp family lipoprotein [Cutibacterium granulosum]MDU3821188.1 Ltp family lipoprotein [Cutibacterium granulosum]